MEIVQEAMTKIKLANFNILELKDILAMPNKFKVTIRVKQKFTQEILNKREPVEGIRVEQGVIHKMVAMVKLEAILAFAAKLADHIVDSDIVAFQDKLAATNFLNS